MDEFMKDYVQKLKPVLLGPKVFEGKWAPLAWSQRRLRSLFGDVHVVDSINQRLSKNDIAAGLELKRTMAGFIDEFIDGTVDSGTPSNGTQPPYILERLKSRVTTLKLLRDVGQLGVLNYSSVELISFLWFLGPAFSGAPK